MTKRRSAHAITREHEIGFQECDPLGVVWHGRYFEWLEAARNQLFASVGLDIPDIRAMGFRMYVVEAHCRYTAPLAYGDSARVTAWFTAVSPLVRVAYDVRDAKRDRRCARAHTVLATTDAGGALLTSTPVVMLQRLPHVASADAAADVDSP